MSEAGKLFVCNILCLGLWCAGFVLHKIDHGKGLTVLGLLACLFHIFAMGASLVCGLGVLLKWRDLSWFGRVFGFIALLPGVMVIAHEFGWIEQLPFWLIY